MSEGQAATFNEEKPSEQEPRYGSDILNCDKPIISAINGACAAWLQLQRCSAIFRNGGGRKILDLHARVDWSWVTASDHLPMLIGPTVRREYLMRGAITGTRRSASDW